MLQHLNISWNSIEDEGVVAISHSLLSLTLLQHLDISINDIRDKEAFVSHFYFLN